MDVLNLFNDTIKVASFNATHLVEAYIISIFSLTTFIGLAITIYLGVAYIYRRPNDPVVGLISCDVLIVNAVCLATLPLWVYQASSKHWFGGEFLCKFSGMFYTMSVYMSTWACVAVTFDRWYCMVCKNLKAITVLQRTIRTNRVVTVLTMMVTFIGLFSLTETSVREGKCYLYSGDSLLCFVNAALGYTLPWLVIAGMIIHIIIKVSKLEYDPKWLHTNILMWLMFTLLVTQGPYYGISTYMGNFKSFTERNMTSVIHNNVTTKGYNEHDFYNAVQIALLVCTHALAITRMFSVPMILAVLAGYEASAVWRRIFGCCCVHVEYESLDEDTHSNLLRGEDNPNYEYPSSKSQKITKPGCGDNISLKDEGYDEESQNAFSIG
ncbi:G protein-coupled receptor 1 [Elephant endotheliotropic herpesvirus 5B]|nr:G protein-coupled receptor 1 [Elephant endotheliotropic herpesvirus 5B]